MWRITFYPRKKSNVYKALFQLTYLKTIKQEYPKAWEELTELINKV